ncbi:MAG: glycosyltransferase [Polyangiaceae bacterium]
MSASIPLTVTARNEEKALGACLASLQRARAFAEARLPIRIAPLVVLDDCSDGTAAAAAAAGVPVVISRGGKVEAQRRGLRPGPFQLFCDADVQVAEETLWALCKVMREEPGVAVAFPPKQPLPLRRHTPLAWALHVYNARRGFSSQRSWFSAKLFAIRSWAMPTGAEMAERARHLPPSRFYDLAAALRVDDIYLSRSHVAAHGVGALRETTDGAVHFRAPETWRGMYRYYRRMRRELERTELLFPELRAAGAQHGSRPLDLLARASATERGAFLLFQVALGGCRLAYRLDRAWVELGIAPPPDAWPAITETKLP